MWRYSIAVAAIVGASLVTACTGDRGDVGLGPACRSEVDAGQRELSRAKANGLSDSVAWTKAASLLGAAKVQQQFEEYQNCLLKARQARRYLAELVNR